MKNLFKSLMFVAVAAMTFTACQKDNNDVNTPVEQTVLKFETTIDETRVTIGEKEDDQYPLTWDGDENVLFDIQDGGPYAWWSDRNSTITVDENNRANASFEVILDGGAAGALADEGSTIYARLGKISGAPNLILYIADQTQTPTATSVDKSFITMMAEFPVEVEGQMVFNGRFEHKAAYGVVTLPAAVNAVEFKTIKIKVNDAKTYTLNVEGLNTHSYWFACEPEAVNSLEVTGVASDDKIYQYTAEGLNKEFTAGVISKFSLKKFEEAASIYMTAQWYSFGSNEFVLEVKDVATDNRLLYLDGYTEDNTILAEGTYNIVDNYNNIPYNIVGSWCNPQLSSGTMVVEHLAKGYSVTINVTGTDEKTYSYTYSGNISASSGDFYNPGDPVKIDAPTNFTATPDTTSIVFDWDDVDKAEGYDVKVTYLENWIQQVAFEGHVEESTYTATELKPLTEYTIEVVATTTAEGYCNSNTASYYASTLADKSALDAEYTDVAEFKVMTKVDGHSNTYLFTTTGGGTTKSDKFMYLSFNKEIDFTVDGEYGFDDINYWGGETSYWLGNSSDSTYSGWSAAQSCYSLSFTPYHVYRNGSSDVCLIYVNANNNDTFTITVYSTTPGYGSWDGTKFKGSFTGAVSEPETEPDPEPEPDPTPDPEPDPDPTPEDGFVPVRAEYDMMFETCGKNDSEYYIKVYNEAGDYAELICHCDLNTDFDDAVSGSYNVGGVSQSLTINSYQAPSDYNCAAGQKYIKFSATAADGTEINVDAQLAATEVDYM